MELQGKKEIEVVPIFYGVNPSDVRNQRGNFALERYQGLEMADTVLGWREALTRIANRKGKDSTQCEDEATMIEDIVRRISSRLLSMLPIDFGDIVGMKTHVEGLSPLLNMDANDEVRMIEIWGMGGIGKTTIAKYIYEQYKHRFSPHFCFIPNVRKISSKHGLLYLQEKLISNILGEEHVKLWSVEQGAHCIKSRLGHLKVFIVLDDVDDVNQLYALAKEAKWFGLGSRIIVTTRDKSLLNNFCGVRIFVYDVKCMDNDNAIKLFEQVAFEGGHPPSHVYKDLSNRVSRLAQGLPLALEAFGFYLHGKSLMEWKDGLKSFEEAPYENIMSILKISYDNLDELGKTAFLHVACLFNGDPVLRVTTLLDCGRFGIRDLVEKSLIDISTDGCIAMHGLVEQTGRHIVCQESGNRPAKQRILWHPDDIYRVLANYAGTRKIEGVALDVCVLPYSFHIEWNALEPMYNLKFLKIYKHSKGSESRIRRNLEENPIVSRKLRLLHWDAYSYTTLPSKVSPDCLVELNLCYSKLTSLWSGVPRLLHLRRLDLTGCEDLKELPDLHEAVCLEELILEGCISLQRIPKSIWGLSRVKKLDVSNCDGLKNLRIILRESESTVFQSSISGMCLHVRLIHMEVLDPTPYEFEGISIPNLSINGEIKIKLELLEGYAEHLCFLSEQEIPHELMMLENQTPKLMSSPYNFKSLDIMRFICSERSNLFKCYSFSDFPWLRDLNLINLNIEEIPDDIHHMMVLEKLDLSGNGFRVLPTTMILLTNLKHLTLCNCCRLETLPDLYQLETLTLSDCTNLQALVNLSDAQQDQSRYCLVELWLDNCKNVQSLSDQLTRFKSLTYLDISRHDFETVPTSIKDLPLLVTLCLNYCKKLKSLKEVLPLSLKYLYAHGCKSLDAFIEYHVHHRDLSPCLQWKQDSSQITRFPAGRRSEEVTIFCYQFFYALAKFFLFPFIGTDMCLLPGF
ncbi:predicted protein [Arabidopsis lyrata subsp. lyrata]|uniref:Predicted protein n=2 Tax=Arabidopsis lyrata subsp. lyrata TaxID=81972 RepID=D7MH87_ARALL|nr:predicted protein [Arabidopsis lyrata subsp. lyrata]